MKQFIIEFIEAIPEFYGDYTDEVNFGFIFLVLIVIGLVWAMGFLVAVAAGSGRSGDNAAVWVLVLFELGFPIYAFRLFGSGCT